MSIDVVVEAIVHDEEVLDRLRAVDAVRWMAEAVDAHHRGELVSPPRVHAELGGSRVVFTSGRLRGSWFGYRSYDTLAGIPAPRWWSSTTRRPGGCGRWPSATRSAPGRVGAIGAVAADALSPPGAGVVAVIGSGTQAYAQVWALASVRDLRGVRVYSRDSARRASFVDRIAPLVPGTCSPAPNARAACEGAEIVVVATSSPTPVLDGAWIAPDAYVTTLGPKQRGRAEFGLDLPEAASVLVTDSLDQIDAYDPPNVLVGTHHERRLVSLGAVRAGEVAAPASGGISLFFSVGLAGTEAFLLDRLTASRRTARQ